MTRNLVFSCLLTLLFYSTLTLAQVTPCPRDTRPLHFIALVHGLGADGRTFGQMDEALEKHLSTDTTYNYCVVKFVFPTGSDKYDLEDFSKMLDLFVFQKMGISKPDDKLSFVAHSEGGLISLLWLQQVFEGSPLYHSEYKQNASRLVTLSTPFWGSGATVVGSYIMAHPRAHALLKINFGALELQDLSYGSLSIWNLFRNLTDPIALKNEADLITKVKVLNIGGSIDPFPGPHSLFREDDVIVPLASARLGALVASDTRTDYEEGDTVYKTAFAISPLAPNFIAVRATHAVRLESLTRHPSIADIKEDCVLDENCSHPSYKYVLDFLAGHPVTVNPIDIQREKRLRDFIFQLNIIFPENNPVDPSQITVSISKVNSDRLKIGSSELKSQTPFVFRKSVHDPNPKYSGYRVVTRGQLLSAKVSVFHLGINSPGFKSRYVYVPVEGGFTTMLELRLAPLTPQNSR